MADKAIILIPDISGFTEFTSTTEIDHSAHIITELLALIVEANDTGFTLAEIEGDAVLFYRTGEPLNRQQLIDQCLSMFEKFHERLMIIERDTVCQCGACQSASGLTLKFIAHFGYIKEIRVASFVKATGVDMIVAHRLLKNDIDSSEYILMTAPCCDAVGHDPGDGTLPWRKASSTYGSIGAVAFEFATLSDHRNSIPTPPPRAPFSVERGHDNVETVIKAPMKTVYQMLINVDRRPDWLMDVDSIDREMTTERIGMTHNCVFMGMNLVNTAADSSFEPDHARYSEHVEMPDIGITAMLHYDLYPEGENTTRLNVNVNMMDSVLPVEQLQAMMEAEVVNIGLLKAACEREAPAPTG